MTLASTEDDARWEWMSARMADLVADGVHGDDAYWQASGEWADRRDAEEGLVMEEPDARTREVMADYGLTAEQARGAIERGRAAAERVLSAPHDDEPF